jgi:hypothetical protein
MEHFSERPWADFVRGISGPEISKDIKAHLAADCSKCKTALDAWSRVRRLASAEDAYAPPENLVRLVKLGFASKPAHRPLAWIPANWTVANLVFDSFAQPLPVGVRSSAALSAWQVVYEAEALTVDLRFGHRAQSKTIHLVGQVFDKRAVRVWQTDATIELSTEHGQLVATTGVNAMGEFHIEFKPQDQLWLSVKAAGRNTVRIPLTNPR